MTGVGVTGVGAGLVEFDPTAHTGAAIATDIAAAMAACVICFDRKVSVIVVLQGRIVICATKERSSPSFRFFTFLYAYLWLTKNNENRPSI